MLMFATKFEIFNILLFFLIFQNSSPLFTFQLIVGLRYANPTYGALSPHDGREFVPDSTGMSR